MNARQIARGLGWFGIGLGAVEVLAPRTVAQAAGLNRPGLVQLFGLREIASGAILLAAEDPQRWLWIRVAGDALDGVALGEGLLPRNPARGRAFLALLAVAPVAALDMIYAVRAGAPSLPRS